jgi:glycosyltransferase involved in cell wall biosynthesis
MIAASPAQLQNQNPAAKCLIVSGVNITQVPQLSSKEQPEKDFALLKSAFEADIIDSENYTASNSAFVRIIKRILGPKWAIAAAAVQIARKYHAIIAMGDDIGVPLAVLLWLSRMSIPYFLISQHMMSRRPAFFFGKLRMHSSVTKFLSLSITQADYLHEQYKISKQQIQLIRWHVDHRFFSPMPEVTVKPQICSAGMTGRDYKTFIDATRGLDIDVKIEAHSAWFNEGVNFTSDQLHNRVEVCSYGTTKALRQLYAESQFVVLPLADVPFIVGYSTLLEAMAMGKPVIVSKTKLIGDFIQDGWNGFYVTPENPEELRERIQYMLDHPEEVKRMGENARRMIEERFTLDHFLQHVQTCVYEAVK